jgi:uncharacterized protein YyaL (SSP411 family)
MERESFEDAATAADLNRDFVAIKVDREERPDLDQVYMGAVQAMTGGGGWPMSVFLTPDGRPFYGGTYFPPQPAHGLPSFRQVLAGAASAWRDQRLEVVAEHDRSDRPDVLRSLAAPPRATMRSGGFGSAPKFPHALDLDPLAAAGGRRTRSRPIATTTLDRMAEGGIRDHLGGGFAATARTRGG